MQTDSGSQWDRYAKKKTRQGVIQKGIRVKPLTTYLQQDPLHKAIWLVLIHCLHVFTGGFIPTGVFDCSQILSSSPSFSISLPSPSMSPFRQGGPESVPAEHGIAAVHHSWQQCLLPEIYIIFACAPASMSTHKVTEH